MLRPSLSLRMPRRLDHEGEVILPDPLQGDNLIPSRA
jgi:hypothetical protein